jgi:hypothetical protein
MSNKGTLETKKWMAQLKAVRIEFPRLMEESIADPIKNITPKEDDCSFEKATLARTRERLEAAQRESDNRAPLLKTEEVLSAAQQRKAEAEIAEKIKTSLEEAEDRFGKAKESLARATKHARDMHRSEREELATLLTRLNEMFPHATLSMISHGTLISASSMEGLITPGALYNDIEAMHQNRQSVSILEGASRYTKATAPLEKIGKGAQMTWLSVTNALRTTWNDLEDTAAELCPIMIATIIVDALKKVGSAGSGALIAVFKTQFPFTMSREEARRDMRSFPDLFEMMASGPITQALGVIHEAGHEPHGTARKANALPYVPTDDICHWFNKPQGCSRDPCRFRHVIRTDAQKAAQTSKTEPGAKAGV